MLSVTARLMCAGMAHGSKSACTPMLSRWRKSTPHLTDAPMRLVSLQWQWLGRCELSTEQMDAQAGAAAMARARATRTSFAIGRVREQEGRSAFEAVERVR